MLNRTSIIWVKSGYFEIEPGEESKTNPGRYGKAFAEWLAERMRGKGHAVVDVSPEDWGWEVTLMKSPIRLSLCCGNRDGEVDEWGVWVDGEVGFLRRLTTPSLKKELNSVVQDTFSVLEKIMSEVPKASSVWMGE